MKVYSNITNFMCNDGISYSDRIVINILLSVICKGYELILFIQSSDNYIKINEQIFAEYYFTKNIISKKKYVLMESFNIRNIEEEDIYLEVDILNCEDTNWEEYYSQLRNTNCQMYLYKFFDNSGNDNDKNSKDLHRLKYMDKIYVSSEQMREEISKKYKECVLQLEIVDLKAFVNTYKKEPFLEIDKGLEKIIAEGKYIVSLYDDEHRKSNRVRLKEIRKSYIDKKIICVIDSKENAEKILKELEKDKEFGENVFVVWSMNYYTVLSLYKSAALIVLPIKCRNCEFEIFNIQNMGKKYIFM